MNYSSVCAEGELSNLKKIIEKILSNRKAKIIKETQPKMIMVKHIDPLDKNEFFLGEILVTYCEVEIEGNIGCGCVIGTSEERSLYAAIIDAFIGNSMSGWEEISELLSIEEKNIFIKREREFNTVLKTKVNFETKKEG